MDMHMMKNASPKIALACSAALLAGAVVTMASADSDSPKEAPAAVVSVKEFTPEEMHKVTTAVVGVQQPIEESFKIFRDQVATPMPAEIAAQIGSPKRFGRNSDLARKIKTVTGDGWVIPGDGWLCLAMPDPVDGYGTSCLPTQIAAKQGLYVGLSGGKGIAAGMSAQTALVSDAMARTVSAQETGSPGVLTGLVKGNIITSSVNAKTR